MNKAIKYVIILLFLVSHKLLAVQEIYSFENIEQKNNFNLLTRQLRCTVCQNQTLFDSMAPLALDLKSEIYSMLLSGKDNNEITDFLVIRYGDFIKYSPPLQKRTYLLWFSPVLLLGAGGMLLKSSFKGNSSK